jgi:pimeloyl-ACP methyl ester carboxylesterase
LYELEAEAVRSKRLVVAVRSKGLVVAAAALAFGAFAPSTMADTRFERIEGFAAPGTPAKFNRVGVLKVGPPRAKNVLVLNPGTSASAAYFAPLARDIVRRVRGWQVWAVERRENLLEDHSVVNQFKAGRATEERLFDYYLGYLTKPSVTDHARMIPNSEVPFARRWGMSVEIEDLRRVVTAAKRLRGKVVVGGHSLGGSITTAYATWDFNGTPGARGLSGLVYIDGGSSPTPVTPEEADQALRELQAGSPWLTFGGIPAPFAGLFNVVASTGVLKNPNGTSELQTWSLLPANLKPPVPTTNLASYGYALDTETSPPGLVAAQAHLGRVAATGDRRGWESAGELTPIRRFARMFSGTGLKSLDGTAWYHPRRLTIDSGAVAAGNANPAQDVLDVRATHGDDLPRGLRLYAFGASLGGTRVLDAARVLAGQSGIPRRNLTLVDRRETYAHNDPNSASPRNAFLARLVPFLARISRR